MLSDIGDYVGTDIEISWLPNLDDLMKGYARNFRPGIGGEFCMYNLSHCIALLNHLHHFKHQYLVSFFCFTTNLTLTVSTNSAPVSTVYF